MSVYKKLNEARALFHANRLVKGGANQNRKYFELGDFLPLALDSFNKSGLAGVVSFKSDEATLTITDIETDKAITITTPFGSAKLPNAHEIQNIGACQTYTRRYLWMTAMEVVEHDALEGTVAVESVEIDSLLVDQINAAETIEQLTDICKEATTTTPSLKKTIEPYFRAKRKELTK